jgi:hypothetical protein
MVLVPFAQGKGRREPASEPSPCPTLPNMSWLAVRDLRALGLTRKEVEHLLRKSPWRGHGGKRCIPADELADWLGLLELEGLS